MGRGSSKANRATYNGKSIYIRKGESVDDAIKRYESKSDTSASGSFLNSTLARGLPEGERGGFLLFQIL